MAEILSRSTIGLTTRPKAFTRGRKACLNCKRRKIRCTVLDSQTSCTNCIYNESDCHFPTSRNQLTPIKTKVSRREANANVKVTHEPEDYQDDARFSRNHKPPGNMASGIDSIDNFYRSVLKEFLQLDESLQPLYYGDSVPPPRTANHRTGTPFCYSSQPNHRLFEFSVLSHIPADEYDYLYTKGALNMPSVSLRNQILRAYITWIHPLLPLLDLPKFLRGVLLRNDCTFEHPILYQAVMFAGSAFLDIKDVRLSGYNTLLKLRQALFQRTKLLYEFDTEPDPFVQTQALLLLTNWYSLAEIRDPWYWLGLAISAARRAGLYDQSDSIGKYQGSYSIRRRVWWCLYARDKVISLEVRKPVQSDQEDYNVPEPQVEDLTSNVIDDPILHEILGSSAVILTTQYQPLLGMLLSETSSTRTLYWCNNRPYLPRDMGPWAQKLHLLSIESKICSTSTRGDFLRETAYVLDIWYSVSIQEQ